MSEHSNLPKTPDLPPGLDPIVASRFGLWLLGVRSHRRAQKRSVIPKRDWTKTLVNRFLGLCAPWTVDEYPGSRQLLAYLLGVERHRAAHIMRQTDKTLPRRHARRLADICEEREAAYRVLKTDLRAWADRPVAGRQGIRREDRGG